MSFGQGYYVCDAFEDASCVCEPDWNRGQPAAKHDGSLPRSLLEESLEAAQINRQWTASHTEA